MSRTEDQLERLSRTHALMRQELLQLRADTQVYFDKSDSNTQPGNPAPEYGGQDITSMPMEQWKEFRRKLGIRNPMTATRED